MYKKKTYALDNVIVIVDTTFNNCRYSSAPSTIMIHKKKIRISLKPIKKKCITLTQTFISYCYFRADRRLLNITKIW